MSDLFASFNGKHRFGLINRAICPSVATDFRPLVEKTDAKALMLNLKIDPDKPILIAGPTASGKSGLAMRLAQRFGGAIINADALQVYQCWRVLTARPSVEDEDAVPHFLYGHIDCDHKYSVGDWLRQVTEILGKSDRRPPVIVGGTGLYFSSLTNGLAAIPDVDRSITEQADAILKTTGLTTLIADLEKFDPASLAAIDRQNPRRVQRAWEVWRSTGRGLLDWQAETGPPLLPLSRCNAILLDAPRDWLTPRIETRFRHMVTSGGLEECQRNLPNWTWENPSARAIGARELISHLKGECGLEEAISAAVIATRQYAKRQRSWFRARMSGWQTVDLSTEPCEQSE